MNIMIKNKEGLKIIQNISDVVKKESIYDCKICYFIEIKYYNHFEMVHNLYFNNKEERDDSYDKIEEIFQLEIANSMGAVFSQ